jgi:hypothetical protein
MHFEALWVPTHNSYLKERRKIFLKRTEMCEPLAAIDDLTIRVMRSNGGKSCTSHRQELPDKKKQNKDEKFLVLSCCIQLIQV